MYGCVEERMFYLLMLLLWRPDAQVSCCKVKYVNHQSTRWLDRSWQTCLLLPWVLTYLFLTHIYSHRNNLKLHRYFSICVEQTLCLFCKFFLLIRQTAYLGCKELMLSHIQGAMVITYCTILDNMLLYKRGHYKHQNRK